ncbi:hypothetical protein D3C84_373450 [compost metagenome]
MIRCAEGVEEAFGGGRGENFADSHCIDQAGTDVAEKRRLMAGASASHDTHLAGRRGFTFADDPRIDLVLGQLRVSHEDALQHVLNHLVRIVYDSIHEVFPCSCNVKADH